MSNIKRFKVSSLLNENVFVPSRIQRNSEKAWKINEKVVQELAQDILDNGWNAARSATIPMAYFINKERQHELISGHHRIEAFKLIRDNIEDAYKYLANVEIDVVDMSNEIDITLPDSKLKQLLLILVLAANNKTGGAQNERAILSTCTTLSKDLLNIVNRKVKDFGVNFSLNKRYELVLSYLYACHKDSTCNPEFDGWIWYESNKKTINKKNGSSFITSFKPNEEQKSLITTHFVMCIDSYFNLLKIAQIEFNRLGTKIGGKAYFHYTIMNMVNDKNWFRTKYLTNPEKFTKKFNKVLFNLLTNHNTTGKNVLEDLGGSQFILGAEQSQYLSNRIKVELA